jgi:PAS domain S-box-containing protein
MLANALPQLAWSAQPDGTITWFNQRWYDYTGTTPEQMEGGGWRNVHHPDELPWVEKLWQTSLESGEPFEMTFPLRGADGTPSVSHPRHPATEC